MTLRFATPSDKELENFPFIGWIPCVSGHLDFCLMSVGLQGNVLNNKKNDPSAKTLNYSANGLWDTHGKRIILKSWVDWRDLLEGDGNARVLVIAECNKDDNLDSRSVTGTVVIYPKRYEKETTFNATETLKLIDSLSDRSRTFDLLTNEGLKFDHWESVQKQLNTDWEKIAEQLSSYKPLTDAVDNVFCVDFHIEHTGFIYLKFRETAHISPEETPENDQYVITRQAYYYLKYALHKHNHHAEEADCLTTIIRNDNIKSSNIGLKLIGQLKRELVIIKRTQHQQSRRHADSEALGILGYTRSLLMSCLQKDFIDEKQYTREKEWLSGMVESFSAQHDGIQIERARKDALSQRSRQWIGIGLAYTSIFVLIMLRIHPSADPAAEITQSTTGKFSVEIQGTEKLTSIGTIAKTSPLPKGESPSISSSNKITGSSQSSGSGDLELTTTKQETESKSPIQPAIDWLRNLTYTELFLLYGFNLLILMVIAFVLASDISSSRLRKIAHTPWSILVISWVAILATLLTTLFLTF